MTEEFDLGGDVRLRLDRERDLISVSMISGAHSNHVVDIPICKERSSLEAAIGRVVLSTMAVSYDDAAAGETGESSGIEAARAEILRRANEGDSAAQTSVAVHYMEQSLERGDASLLDIAESWFERAATSGDSAAKRFFADVWPILKRDYSRRLGG